MKNWTLKINLKDLELIGASIKKIMRIYGLISLPLTICTELVNRKQVVTENIISPAPADSGPVKVLREMANHIPFRRSELVVLESLVCILLLILALVGNMIIIIVVFKKPRLSTTTSLFIAALATTDLINALVPGPLFLSSLVTGKMPYSSEGCDISGFFMQFLTLASVSTMDLIAVNRYFCVLKPNIYKRIFTSRNSAIFLVSLWIFIGMVIVFPLTVGWASMEFSPQMALCSLHFNSLTSETGFTIFVMVSFVVSSFVIVSLSYYFVSKSLRQHRNHLSNNSGLSAQEINLTRTFFVLVVSFIVLWLPTFVVVILFRVVLRKTLPRQLALAIPYGLLANSAVNPWIYGAMNPSFRKKFLSLLKRSEAPNRVLPAGNAVSSYLGISRSVPLQIVEEVE